MKVLVTLVIILQTYSKTPPPWSFNGTCKKSPNTYFQLTQKASQWSKGTLKRSPTKNPSIDPL